MYSQTRRRYLSNIGYKLQSIGLTEGAARSLLKGGDVKGAVDSCVLLNLWDKAVELAQLHALPQIEGLLGRYAAASPRQRQDACSYLSYIARLTAILRAPSC